MDLFLLQVLALLRPIFFYDVGVRLFGLNLFELAAIMLSGILVAGFMFRIAISKNIALAPLDLFVVAFTAWCICVFLIYPDKSDIKEVAKLVIPLMTLSISRAVIPDRTAHERILLLMIIGFIFPIVASAVLIVMGQSVVKVSYWTGLPRYVGVYANVHNLAHNAMFLVVLIVVYLTLVSGDQLAAKINWIKKTSFTALALVGLYCMYAARVRTTLLGLLVFFAVYLFHKNKKLLLLGAGSLLVVGIAFSQVLIPHFFYDAMLVEQGKWGASELGSNRPNIWRTKAENYLNLPWDRQIAGFGIGNKFDEKELLNPSHVDELDSHNDYLEVFVETGPVGFALFMAIWILIYQGIKRLSGNERHVMMALFMAVTAMNLVSNSYVSRFGLAQMFYLVIAFAGLGASSEKRVNSRVSSAALVGLVGGTQLPINSDRQPNSRGLR